MSTNCGMPLTCWIGRETTAGQMQDVDGATYADLATSQGRAAAPNEAFGDMKAIDAGDPHHRGDHQSASELNRRLITSASKTQ